MTDIANQIDRSEQDLLAFEVSDSALEAAACLASELAGAATVAFCSGLDTCPA